MASEPSAGPAVGRPAAVVGGGGLAGLAAAVRLAELGVRPLLFEKRPFLGGRAYSFVDGRSGEEIDGGQHVFLGACTEYVAFLKAIGAWGDVHLPGGLDVPVLLRGRVSRIRSAGLPGPLGMAAALVRYGHLSPAEKLRVAYAVARAALERREPGGALERTSFEKWLMWHGQTERTIARFWNLIVLAALNDVSRWVSADAGLMLVQTALLGDPSGAAIGWSRVGLTRLVDGAVRRRIEAAGGRVRTGVAVAGVEVGRDGIAGVRLADGTVLEADVCILAVPFDALAPLLPAALAGSEPFARAGSLETSPIVAVHIWYDRPVLEGDFVAVLGSPVQWVFNLSSIRGERDPARQHVLISLSGAREWMGVTKSKLSEAFVFEMARLFPPAVPGAVQRTHVVKSRDATFRSTPGSARGRLPQRTCVRGLFLAGDWTSTGWPSTMEGAVRSGRLAAEAAAHSLSERAQYGERRDVGG